MSSAQLHNRSINILYFFQMRLKSLWILSDLAVLPRQRLIPRRAYDKLKDLLCSVYAHHTLFPLLIFSQDESVLYKSLGS